MLLFPSSRKDRCSTSQHSRKSLKDSPRQAPHCALVQCSVHRDQEFIASLHRAAFPGRQDRPCYSRQPPAPDSTDIRASSSTTRQPGVVAERRRGLLRQAETRRLPISGRVCGVVDSLHRLFGFHPLDRSHSSRTSHLSFCGTLTTEQIPGLRS